MQQCLTGAHDGGLGGPTTEGLIANTFDVKTGDLNSLQSSLKGDAALDSLHLAPNHALLIKHSDAQALHRICCSSGCLGLSAHASHLEEMRFQQALAYDQWQIATRQ